MPAQHVLDGAGAARVFDLEISLLKELGWRVVLFVVAPGLKLRRESRARWLQSIASAAHRFDVDGVRIVERIRPFRAWLAVLRIVQARFRNRWDLTTDLAASDLLDVSGLREASDGASSAGERPSIVVCNYLSGVAVADALAPHARQILVLHDVAMPRLSGRVAAELRARPHLVALSKADAGRVEKEIPGATCHVGVPLGGDRPLDFADLLGCSHLADVLDASGHARAAAGGWSQSEWATRPTLDLLFVGGAHHPNVEGLASFVSGCFLPHLAPKGVSLVVAGDVGRALWGGGETPRGIVWLGRVERLRPLYAAAKLVVVPLLSGTGVSIKTVEAMSLGKAVVSSGIGLRGLACSTSCGLEAPFDRRWAERICQLLGSRALRRELRATLRSAAGTESLDSALRQRLESISGGTGPSRAAIASAPAQQHSPLVEWVGDLDPVLAVLGDASLQPEERRKRLAELLVARGFGPGEACDDVADDLLGETDRLLAARSLGNESADRR